MSAQRTGIILPAVVFVLLIVELLAVTTLAIAYGESGVATQVTLAARSELAARDGLLSLLGDSVLRPQAVAPGMRVALPAGSTADGSGYRVEIERLAGALFLARAEGSHGPAQRRIRSKAALLLESTDPLPILAQFPGTLGTQGPVTLAGGSVVDGSNPAIVPSQWMAADCASWIPPALLVSGLTAEPASSFDRLGTMPLSIVDPLADRHESGALDLSPAAISADCLTGSPANWGAPLDRNHPCASYSPLIYAATDLSLASGSGQGILVVDGDLTMASGTRFYGLILIRGRLTMAANSEIVGAVLARSAPVPSILTGARITRCECAIARALQNTSALNRLAPRRGRSWIPHF